MSEQTIRAINNAVYFSAGGTYERPAIRPWQYVQIEYERVGLVPPAHIPAFDRVEDAQIWMCLDAAYNTRMRERAWLQAV